MNDENESHLKSKSALAKSRSELSGQQAEQSTQERSALNTSVASACEKISNKTLGSHLASYLKSPFFKGYTKANLEPLGQHIKANLYQALKADRAYQSSMAKMWAEKTPDRAKIERLHSDTVTRLAKDIVDHTVLQTYPSYKGTAKPAAKPVAAKATAKPLPSKAGEATWVTKRPASSEIDFSRPDSQILLISGRAHLKTGEFVRWRKN